MAHEGGHAELAPTVWGETIARLDELQSAIAAGTNAARGRTITRLMEERYGDRPSREEWARISNDRALRDAVAARLKESAAFSEGVLWLEELEVLIRLFEVAWRDVQEGFAHWFMLTELKAAGGRRAATATQLENDLWGSLSTKEVECYLRTKRIAAGVGDETTPDVVRAALSPDLRQLDIFQEDTQATWDLLNEFHVAPTERLTLAAYTVKHENARTVDTALAFPGGIPGGTWDYSQFDEWWYERVFEHEAFREALAAIAERPRPPSERHETALRGSEWPWRPYVIEWSDPTSPKIYVPDDEQARAFIASKEEESLQREALMRTCIREGLLFERLTANGALLGRGEARRRGTRRPPAEPEY